MGRHNDEAGLSPALSRNCNPLPAESQVDPLTLRFHMPRGQEVEAQKDTIIRRLNSSLSQRQGFFVKPK